MKFRIDAPARERLAFLDGLRGLAALYVVLFHAMVEAHASGRSGSHPAVAAFAALRHGHYAVDVFIVLSGYCLMRPVARDPGGRLAGGFVGYLGRRARRIVPPYYAALGLCWLLAATVPALGRRGGGPWDVALPTGGVGVVASHLLLVQNWGPGWIYRIDPPAWTVATEWQIYLLFPALITLWRRAGPAATVAIAFGLGWAIAGLGLAVSNPAMVRLCPWLLGLFALGMAAAADGDGQGPLRRPLGWVAAAVVALGVPTWLDAPNRDVMLADPIVGGLAALLIARLVRRSGRGESSPMLRLLSSRAACRLGSISYSLYLIHFPLLALAGSLLRARGVGPGAQLAAMLGLAAPACVAAAGLFALAFERSFLPRRTGAAAPSGPLARAGRAGSAQGRTAGAA
jgi:peptidoglycan/LPS O-acetylase OafA/YrhL